MKNLISKLAEDVGMRKVITTDEDYQALARKLVAKQRAAREKLGTKWIGHSANRVKKKLDE